MLIYCAELYCKMPNICRASRPRRPSVVTEWPSEEHSYSVATLPVEDVSEDRDSPVDNEYDWGSEEDEEEDVDSVSDTSEDESSDQADSAGEEKPTKRRRSSHPAPKRSARLKGLKVKLSTPPVKRRRYLPAEDDEDEQKKIEEGADALLNLAGITTTSIVPMRSISPTSSNTNNNNNEIKVEKMEEGEDQQS